MCQQLSHRNVGVKREVCGIARVTKVIVIKIHEKVTEVTALRQQYGSPEEEYLFSLGNVGRQE